MCFVGLGAAAAAAVERKSGSSTLAIPFICLRTESG